MTVEEITTELPDPEEEDVAEALHFVAEALRERQLPPHHRVRFLIDENLSPPLAELLPEATTPQPTSTHTSIATAAERI